MEPKNKKNGIVERVAEAPAVAVEKTVEGAAKVGNILNDNKPVKEAKEYWKMLGPGLTTGAADDDPSGIATYSQTGSRFGFSFLWLASFTFPLMAIVQEMCARIGIVTGRGLAGNIKAHYPRWVIYLCTALLFVANSLNIGADLGAMAKATQLVWPSLSFGILIALLTMLTLALQIFTTYERYARYLKYLALILLSYVLTAFLVGDINWSNVLKDGLVPNFGSLDREKIILICAILGTTISPYLFFWQTSQEVEEQIMEGKTTIAQRQAVTTDKDIKSMRVDVWSGMFLSNIVMFFIILTCALTLNASGITTINTAADAANALRPLAGDGAYLLFALGIIGTGLLAVPVLAGSTSYAMSESLGWKEGLYRKLKEAYAFYGIIIISTLIGVIINFVGIDPIKALIYSAVANGLIAPVVLILIVLTASNKKIMGDRANSGLSTFFGWLVVVIMVIGGLAAIGSLVF